MARTNPGAKSSTTFGGGAGPRPVAKTNSNDEKDFSGVNMTLCHYTVEEWATYWRTQRNSKRKTNSEEDLMWGQRLFEGAQKTLRDMGHRCDGRCDDLGD